MASEKIFITLSILIILIGVTASSGCIQEAEIYTAGVSPAYYPLSEQNHETQKFTGLDIDILNWIAQDQNIKFEFVPMFVSGYKEAVESGEIDLMSAMTVIEERKQTIDFSNPYLTSDFQIIAKKGSDVTLEDVISGSVILAVQMGSAQELWIKNKIGQEEYDKRIGDGRIIQGFSVYGVLKDVTTTTADATIISTNVVSGLLEQYPTLQSVGATKETTYTAYGVSKNESELLEKINAGLANLKASGDWNKLLGKYNIAAKKDTYKIGVDINFSPFAYLDENAELVGYDVDSIKWIAENQGFDVEFVSLRFSEYENAINNGIIDAWYCYLPISDSRMNAVTFTNPYYHSANVVVSLSGSGVTEKEYEAGEVRTGLMTGSSNSKWIGRYFFDNYDDMILSGGLVYYDNLDDMKSGIHSKEVDAIALPRVFVNDEIIDGTYNIILEIGKGDAAAAVKNGDVYLIEMLNKGIDELFSSNQDDVLKDKYNMRRVHI